MNETKQKWVQLEYFPKRLMPFLPSKSPKMNSKNSIYNGKTTIPKRLLHWHYWVLYFVGKILWPKHHMVHPALVPSVDSCYQLIPHPLQNFHKHITSNHFSLSCCYYTTATYETNSKATNFAGKQQLKWVLLWEKELNILFLLANGFHHHLTLGHQRF